MHVYVEKVWSSRITGLKRSKKFDLGDSKVIGNTQGTQEKVRDSESSRQRVFGIMHVDCNSAKPNSVKGLVRNCFNLTLN